MRVRSASRRGTHDPGGAREGLKIQVSNEVNGLEMGVLSDGTAYLSGRALSKLCDVANSSIVDASSDWSSGKRASKLSQWITERGFARDSLYVKTEKPGVAGNFVNAYTDDVVSIILEYYAFEAPIPSKPARENYRILNDVNTVLDISIGQAWAAHWKGKDLEAKFGPRQKHEHNYPDYFPQAKSNPQDMNVYPIAALPEFRVWLQTEYIPKRFPAYLKTKISLGVLPASAAELVLHAAAPGPKQLSP